MRLRTSATGRYWPAPSAAIRRVRYMGVMSPEQPLGPRLGSPRGPVVRRQSPPVGCCLPSWLAPRRPAHGGVCDPAAPQIVELLWRPDALCERCEETIVGVRGHACEESTQTCWCPPPPIRCCSSCLCERFVVQLGQSLVAITRA